MHISQCFDPKRIVNPYTKEIQWVPCGECPACLQARSFRWTERLTQERYCWQYCLFFTLTYNDEHLPILRGDNDFLYDVSPERCHPELGNIAINVSDFFFEKGLSYSQKVKERSFIKTRMEPSSSKATVGLPYLSTYDAQKFIKRVRINLSRTLKRINSNESDKIRYAICGEYGPTTFRPHMHGLLFFNGEAKAAHIQEIISKSWQYGFVDTSFVSGTNASYVSSYINSFGNLPYIYRHRRLRPFLLTSKSPALGTLAHSTQSIKSMFFEASPEICIFDHKKGLFENVPMWRIYRDRLFPKLARFDELSHIERIRLYQCVNNFKSENIHCFLNDFSHRCAKDSNNVYSKYLALLSSYKGDITAKLQRLYSVSSRVCYQAESFGITVRSYVNTIEKFYDNLAKEKYRSQLEFENNYVEEGHNVSDLLSFDLECFQHLLILPSSTSPTSCDLEFFKSLIDLDYSNFDANEIERLRSFGIDVDKLFDDNLTNRQEYIYSLLPKNTWDYKAFTSDMEKIYRASTKTKDKNDYQFSDDDIKASDVYTYYGDF